VVEAKRRAQISYACVSSSMRFLGLGRVDDRSGPRAAFQADIAHRARDGSGAAPCCDVRTGACLPSFEEAVDLCARTGVGSSYLALTLSLRVVRAVHWTLDGEPQRSAAQSPPTRAED
jgi:hypothetical protein